MKGECVTAINVEHFPELTTSGRNMFCHFIDNDNSGSSNKIMHFSIFSIYNFENTEMICFSPDDKF